MSYRCIVHPGPCSRMLVGLALLSGVATAQKIDPDIPSPSVVGVSQKVDVLPNPRQAYQSGDTIFWTRLLQSPNASFLKLHFVNVNIKPGDTLTLRSKSGKLVETITGRGPKDLGSFWALSVFSDEVLVEFSTTHRYNYFPFRIDQIISGDPNMFDRSSGSRSICTPADFEDAICYQSDAGKWSNVMASAGVMTVGGNPVSALWCSASNVSPLNYVLTNDHCVTGQSGCDTAEFVFKFYRTGCNDGSPPTVDWEGFHCDQLVASSPYISCEQGLNDLDFSLCSVIGDIASSYGYANPDPIPITDGEDIYIIQHPSGRPHEITHGGGVNVDADGTVLRYYDTLDTEPGSSGSPIYREADDMLIGLHHCGGCSTAGTGNRGMLMSDIYPLIQNYLCTDVLDVMGVAPDSLTLVSGNGDTLLDPGEIWEFTPRVRNTACSLPATNVTAQVQVNASSAPVTLLQTAVEFGDVPGSSTASAISPIRFVVELGAPCGGTVILDMVNLTAANGGPFGDVPEIVSREIGGVITTGVFFDDFAGGTGTWSIVDGGSGGGAAATWTTGNPGGRSLSLTAPFFIVDSDEAGTSATQDETLTSGTIDLTGFSGAQLQFAHDFNHYSGGQDEQADVDVYTSASGWVNVANFSGGDASGTVTIDISAVAAGQPDVQVRFHYYNGSYEWWWAIDDVTVLGDNWFSCHPYLRSDRDALPRRKP